MKLFCAQHRFGNQIDDFIISNNSEDSLNAISGSLASNPQKNIHLMTVEISALLLFSKQTQTVLA